MLLVAALLLLVSLLFWRMWQIRGQVAQIGWAPSMVASEPGDRVTATWLGTTTLLFDDGETQVLIDGAFTRVGPSWQSNEIRSSSRPESPLADSRSKILRRRWRLVVQRRSGSEPPGGPVSCVRAG